MLGFFQMKRSFNLFALSFILTAGCAGPSTRVETKPPSSPMAYMERKPATDEMQAQQAQKEEQIFSEWQEQHHRHYFDWPVDDARMTRGWLPNRKKPHLGLDLAAPRGTRIYASHAGTVIYAGRDFRGFGKMVMIEGTQGWATLYAHLHKIDVKEGQRVSQGDMIGQMGRTGRATGVHLHFEIRRTAGPVDPLLYLPGGSRFADSKAKLGRGI